MKTSACLLILIATVLAACAGTQPPPTPSVPLAASVTQTPSSTPQVQILRAQPLFPVLESQFIEATPIPIATPAAGSLDFSLKAWTDQDALALIQLMDAFAYDSDIPGTSFNRMRFQGAQGPVYLAVLEGLARFPTSDYAEDFGWKLAFTNALKQDEQQTSLWLQNTLEEGLNRGIYTTEMLGRLLTAFGFQITETIEVPDLFGEGEPGVLYHISTQASGRDGLVAALRQTGNGRFEFEIVHSGWGFAFTSVYLKPEEFRDHNGNGFAEIPLDWHWHSGMDCDTKGYLYEWDGDQFVDLTQEEIRVGECAAGWAFDEVDQNGLETIFVNDIDYYTGGKEDRLAWNGNYYQVIDRQWYLAENEIIEPWENDDFETAEAMITSLLAAISNEDGPRIGGPGVPDLLRFYQAMIHIYHSEDAQARQAFQDLASTPTDPEHPAFSLAAEAFLTKYHGREDLFTACSAAHQAVGQYVSANLQNYEDVSYKEIEDIMGIIGYGISIYGSCEFSKIRAHLMESVRITSIDDLLQWQGYHGIEVPYISEIDLNRDGHTDWILVEIMPDVAHKEIVLVLTYPDRIAIVDITPYYVDEFLESSKRGVEFLELPGEDDPVFFVWWDTEMEIYKLVEGDDSVEVDRLVKRWLYFSEFEIITLDPGPEIRYYDYSEGGYTPYFRSYTLRWDPVAQEFVEVDLVIDVLFHQNNPQEAIQIIQHTLEKFTEYKIEGEVAEAKARLLYLLGLAYELSGQPQLALQSYYQVWQNFPASPYALMARAKLEPVEP